MSERVQATSQTGVAPEQKQTGQHRRAPAKKKPEPTKQVKLSLNEALERLQQAADDTDQPIKFVHNTDDDQVEMVVNHESQPIVLRQISTTEAIELALSVKAGSGSLFKGTA